MPHEVVQGVFKPRQMKKYIDNTNALIQKMEDFAAQ